MPRLLIVLVVVALALLGVGGLLLYFSYGVSDAPPARAEVAGLHRPVEIAWGAGDAVTIRADNLQDAYTGLGYAHGLRRAWPVTLWRQTAAGRLAEWFGQEVLALDRLTRRLGLAAGARTAYDALPEEDQALLRAYAGGMNAALGSEIVRRQSVFALLDREPASWEPWHALAIERLFAWLAAGPVAPAPGAALPPDSAAAAFLAANERLHAFLHLHGFAHSLAWAVRDAAATHLAQRHVYGASALPLYQEIILELPEATRILAASLPGAPVFPAGRGATHAWALLPSSTARLERAAYDSAAAARSYARLTTKGGTEHLLLIRRQGDALLLSARPDTAAASSPPADSVWQVRWAGLVPRSDLAAWQALLAGAPASFRLFDGDGLRVDSSGAWTVTGDPRVVRQLEAGVVVGNIFWADYAAEQLAALATPNGRAGPARLVDHDSSTWAAQLAPDMLASLDSLPAARRVLAAEEERPPLLAEAVTYLRNWNFNYDPASIGASIFDTWVKAYRARAGHLPAPQYAGGEPPADTTGLDSLRTAEDRRRYQALRRAVTALDSTFGSDLSRWRWERVMPDERHFPVWSSVLRQDRRFDQLARTRYAPLRFTGRGHPSTLSWGSSPAEAGPPAPSAWESWISTGAWDRLYVRRRRLDLDAPLGRYRAPERRPPPVLPGSAAASAHTTRLVPAS